MSRSDERAESISRDTDDFRWHLQVFDTVWADDPARPSVSVYSVLDGVVNRGEGGTLAMNFSERPETAAK